MGPEVLPKGVLEMIPLRFHVLAMIFGLVVAIAIRIDQNVALLACLKSWSLCCFGYSVSSAFALYFEYKVKGVLPKW
jgi:hypothetical protein